MRTALLAAVGVKQVTAVLFPGLCRRRSQSPALGPLPGDMESSGGAVSPVVSGPGTARLRALPRRCVGPGASAPCPGKVCLAVGASLGVWRSGGAPALQGNQRERGHEASRWASRSRTNQPVPKRTGVSQGSRERAVVC